MKIQAGDILKIKSSREAFDEWDNSWEQHFFRVDEVHDDCVCGIALTGSLAGSYGEPTLDLIKEIYRKVEA